MTKEVLRKKTGRYLCGLSVRSETMQIQNWLSCTDKPNVSDEERAMIENEIAGSIRAYADATLEVPNKTESWWRKVVNF